MRFKQRDDEEEEMPGPGAYDDARLINQLKRDKDKGSKPFKDNIKREVFKQGKDKKPDVGMYDLKHGTIEAKQSQAIEIDPDLVIEKPAFNSGCQRFKKEEIPKSKFPSFY